MVKQGGGEPGTATQQAPFPVQWSGGWETIAGQAGGWGTAHKGFARDRPPLDKDVGAVKRIKKPRTAV